MVSRMQRQIQNAECRMQIAEANSECRMQNAELIVIVKLQIYGDQPASTTDS